MALKVRAVMKVVVEAVSGFEMVGELPLPDMATTVRGRQRGRRTAFPYISNRRLI